MKMSTLHKVYQSGSGTRAHLGSSASPFSRNGELPFPVLPRTASASAPTTRVRKANGGVLRVNAILDPFHLLNRDQTVRVKATISQKVILGGVLSNLGLLDRVDDVKDLLGRSLMLELVSSEANDGTEGQRISGYAHKVSQGLNEIKYECNFDVPINFGEVGAVVVQNEGSDEMYLNNIIINVSNGPITIPCNSWIQSKFISPSKRVFFTNKSYLPSQTPSGLKKLRQQDLESLRGNGDGERKKSDRIYDYDKYNDLGSPDSGEKLARPVLGGSEHPYPRRCRTGRGPTKTDPSSESRTLINYVPRDEVFSDIKTAAFGITALRSVISAVIPTLETALIDADRGFPHFTRIDMLYEQGVPLPENQGTFKLLLPRLVKTISDGVQDVLLFEPPDLWERDRFSWNKDDEFSRQTLAGLNPLSIQLVTEWPMTSKLDPTIYGEPVSAITKEIIEKEIKGLMTLEEAIENKKLFALDYHDLLLPFVEKVRGIEGSTLYGSRTLFFQCEDNTLRPVAIELTRPPLGDMPQWRHVFTPSGDATNSWLWTYAKAHVVAHDAVYHQLVIHWLRTHCCMEPYIIAARRQLSEMHPISRLLQPHFRYNMEINALARGLLINADGVIESTFSSRGYSMELSSAAYDKIWRFDMEALPQDLIRRGMAVEDPTAEHGVKLTIEDYPFANDGLVLWDAIKSWVSDYVNHYYPDSKTVETDSELQGWWTEVRTKGHEDKKDEPWWPVLNSVDSLIQTLSTIIWVASGHHAAVNFGQYAYGGYIPNRPTIARTNVPNEDPTEESYKDFMAKPEAGLLKCLPSQIQATKVMAVLNILSSHSPDEEYIGDEMEPSWSADPVIKAAFERYAGKLKIMEGIVDARNEDPNLRNRYGAGVVPYELLKPVSTTGLTGMGVPNSVSI